MFYNLLFNKTLPHLHPILPAYKGLNDLAFEQGWRIQAVLSNKGTLENIALNTTEDQVLDEEHFNELLHQMMDDEHYDSHHMRSTYPSKLQPETYNRGPYSKYTRG